MANVLAALVRTSNTFCSQVLVGQSRSVIFQSQAIRNLYSKVTLGVDGYLEQKRRIASQLANIAPMFRDKMKEYTSDDSKNMVFTEDLKNMVHIAENDEDVELVIKMMKKFNQQNKQLRFGNYVFGPVIMRMFHTLKKPDEALECFKATELDGLFDQLITYQILLDLLYESEKYNEILDCFGIIKDRQIEGIKFAKNVVVLTLAACYKMNSKESLEYALKLWSELLEIGHLPMRRATTFCAGLALNQGKPEVALEILTSSKYVQYATLRNLRVSALVSLGRTEEAISALKRILQLDSANTKVLQTYNRDVIDKVKETVEKSGTKEMKVELNRIEKCLQEQGQLCETSLDEQLCQEIAVPPFTGRMSKDAFTRPPRYSRFQRTNDVEHTNNRQRAAVSPRQLRPGLNDLQ
ncbi:hypothetical protein ILUMI_09580 [Ignelater luminosus]|uniref:Pentatricopeptide repeat-containing protein 2, mitochondrial n=1 Tax=Ignelater luminosus TaxID=2038154 RepID=A0A8K0G9I5_IGNLU|nr:hypothetical protein ILUMI_09580 [Ignelater luminosus]